MSLFDTVSQRAAAQCELCTSKDKLSLYEVPPLVKNNADHAILLCSSCSAQINGTGARHEQYWYCLKDSVWTPVPAVQVVAYRLLQGLKTAGWAQELLEQVYLDETSLAWAQQENAVSAAGQAEQDAPTFDSNGVQLLEGDSVTLVKDLDVKGANFTAKRGTLVKNISLTGDPDLIEGKVNGTHIVLKTCFLKKA